MGQERIVIVGAGVGGLAAAMRLSAMGHIVTVLDRAPQVGGKIRTQPTPAGPADTGPTVLTLRAVFDRLFADVGTRLEDHVTLTADPILARHWWPDGSTLDLYADAGATADAIATFAGPKAARDYQRFAAKAARLFEHFSGPMMETAAPSALGLTWQVLRQPSLIALMSPLSTLAQALARDFDDPRLRQLYGRYATYVGGAPHAAPALLSLISHAEAMGVWACAGGLHGLARAMQSVAAQRGAQFCLGTDVKRITVEGGRATGVQTSDGYITANRVIFNGDPAALTQGLMGDGVAQSIPMQAAYPRSLSAYVWAFAAAPHGVDLSHHNVFFGTDPQAEFGPLSEGAMPRDPTLYVCAQDRGGGAVPRGLERFEIIMNGPTTTATQPTQQEVHQCRTLTFHTLANPHGLTFTPAPTDQALTTPAGFNRMFPASQGALYGRSPHGMMAAFKRPTARTRIAGLYLVGGGAHPGAGMPMAALSAQHVVGAIVGDQTSTSTSPKMATRGGISTV